MNTKRGNIFIAFVLLLALATAAGAYELFGYRWPSNAANYKCDSSLSSAFCDSVKYGAERWNGVSGSPFRWLYYANSSSVAKLGYVDGKRRNVLGKCVASRNSNNTLIQSVQVIFDDLESWYTGSGTPSSTKYDVRSIAAHEMGHCLGLKHTQESRCDDDEDDRPTMCEGTSFYDGETYLRDLETDDKNGVKARYPNTKVATSSDVVETVIDVAPLFAETCDTDYVDVSFFQEVLSPRQRLRYSEVVVRGIVTNVTATRFNSEDNCTWSEPDGTMGNWTIFYTIELGDVESVRDGGYDIGQTLTVTVQGKNPQDKEQDGKVVAQIGDEVVAFLFKSELPWHGGRARDVFYPASSPKTSFLIKSSGNRFYEVGEQGGDDGQTFEAVSKSVKSTKYNPQ